MNHCAFHQQNNNSNFSLPSLSALKMLSTPENFRAKLLEESNNLTRVLYRKSAQDVLTETPKSHSTKKPRAKQIKTNRERIIKEAKNSIQEEVNKEADSLVLQNRLSWETYDNIRKSQGLKRKLDGDKNEPNAKRRIKTRLLS